MKKNSRFGGDLKSLRDPYLIVSAAKDPAHETALTESFSRPDLIVTTNETSYPLEGYEGLELALNNSTNPRINYPIREQEFQEYVFSGNNRNETKERYPGVSDDRKKFLRELYERIDEEADGRPVLVNTYSNKFGSSFLKEKGHFVLGPSTELVGRYDDKINSYALAKNLGIPVVEGGVASNLEDAQDIYEKLIKKYPAVFMSPGSSLGGGEDIKRVNGGGLVDISINVPYIVTGWINKLGSPSSQVLIGKDKVLYLGMGDQIIEEGVKYGGNLFPSIMPEDVQKTVRGHSLRLANQMRNEGYRGFSGFDWMVSKDGGVYFSEINPRKTRQTSIFAGLLNSYKPEDQPSFTELEILATLNMPWGNVSEIQEWMPNNPVHWGTKVYSSEGKIVVNEDIEPEYSDNTIFLDSPEKGRSSVLNFPRKGVYLPNFGRNYSLARIIATGSDRESVLSGLEREVLRIEDSYSRINRG